MTDRVIACFFYATAYAFGIAAALIMLGGFIDYLQTGHWSGVNLLELGYDTHVIKARWFLEHRWSWWIRDVLRVIPLSVALIVSAPLVWLIAARVEQR